MYISISISSIPCGSEREILLGFRTLFLRPAKCQTLQVTVVLLAALAHVRVEEMGSEGLVLGTAS